MTTKSDKNLSSGADALAHYVPPHNIQAEQAVLGAMLIQPAVIADLLDQVRPDDFYREGHGALFASMAAMFRRGAEIDLVTVQDDLLRVNGRLESVGGMAYLTALFDSVPSAANARHYASVVADKAALRRLIDGALTVVGMARQPEAESGEPISAAQVVAEAHRLIDAGMPLAQSADAWDSITDVLGQAWDEFNTWQQGGGRRVDAISTGIWDLDDALCGGLMRGESTYVAARPSMGKSALIGKIVSTAIRQDVSAAVISTEVKNKRTVQRMLCADAGIPMRKAMRGEMMPSDWDAIQRQYEALMTTSCRFYREDRDFKADSLVSNIERAIRVHNVGLVVLDHIGHTEEGDKPGRSRNDELARVSRALQNIARRRNVAMVIATQLSRLVERRDNKRPILSDLRDCGELEQNADVVLGLYRADYYAEEHMPPEQTQPVEILGLKGRDIGAGGRVVVGFTPALVRFEDTGGTDEY